MTETSDKKQRTPDLMSTLIILLISGAITIFLFWISTQFLGLETFSKLPDFITGTYKGFWTSAITGTVGIGLAIVKAFTRDTGSQPNYLKLIAITTLALLIPIAALVAISNTMLNQKRGRLQMPPGITQISDAEQGDKDFDLENTMMPPPRYVTLVLKGNYHITNRRLIGHLKSGKITFIKDLPKLWPSKLNRITFNMAYIKPIDGIDQTLVTPEHPKSMNSIDMDATIEAGSTITLPEGDFTFDLPAGTKLDRAWLNGGVWTDFNSVFPAQ